MNIANPFNSQPESPTLDSAKTTTARVIAVSGGKGGVGKSSITINLAVELSRYNKRVCVFDADTNLANINILTGLNPQNTLRDLIVEKKPLKEVMMRGPVGIHIIPAASGLVEWISHNPHQQQKMLDLIKQLEKNFDYILIDTAAGINETVLSFLQAAPETLITITTEPTSLTDAFSLLKVLKKQGYNRQLRVLVNRAESYEQARDTIRRFSGALKKYLGLRILSPGYLLEDRNVSRAIMVQRPFVLMYPKSPATRCLRNFAAQLNENKVTHQLTFSDFLAGKNQDDVAVEPKLKQQQNQKVTNNKPWMNDLVNTIRADSFKEVEQMMAYLSEIWLQRVEQESHKSRFIDPKNFRTALRVAQKIKPRVEPDES